MTENLEGPEDCVKMSILILESLTAQGVEPENQLRVAEGMLNILKLSFSDERAYNEQASFTKQEMADEVKKLLGDG